MKTVTVTMVRIYLSEGEAKLDVLLKRLHDWEHVRGVTVFRGISGFGPSGKIHAATFLDLSLDLPVVVEFFDEPHKVRQILEHLAPMIPPGHVTCWDAQVVMDTGPSH